jgi:hypothetical protein
MPQKIRVLETVRDKIHDGLMFACAGYYLRFLLKPGLKAKMPGERREFLVLIREFFAVGRFEFVIHHMNGAQPSRGKEGTRAVAVTRPHSVPGREILIHLEMVKLAFQPQGGNPFRFFQVNPGPESTAGARFTAFVAIYLSHNALRPQELPAPGETERTIQILPSDSRLSPDNPGDILHPRAAKSTIMKLPANSRLIIRQASVVTLSNCSGHAPGGIFK